MSSQLIHEALLTALDAANIESVPFIAENMDEKAEDAAVSADQFLVPHILPTDIFSLGKNLSSADQEEGIFQVSIYHRAGKGTFDSLSTVENIRRYFYHGRQLGNGVFVDKTNRKAGRSANGWYIIDVEIEYLADIARGDILLDGVGSVLFASDGQLLASF